MLILLPPSEGKQNPESGEPLNFESLFAADALTDLRRTALSPQMDLSCARPAHEIYSGVLYKALDWPTLTRSEKARGSEAIRIFSALYGAIKIDDVISPYKRKMSTSYWKTALTEIFDSLEHKVFVDCRSSTYSSVWLPPLEKSVAVRVFQMKDGKRTVITHMSKKYRGELTRNLLKDNSPSSPSSPMEVHTIAEKYFRCELNEPTRNTPWYLDLLIDL